jgi:hypothetical protein
MKFVSLDSRYCYVRSVAFPTPEYNEVFSDYQQGKVVEWTEMVFETLVFSPFNHLTRLIA